MTSINFDFGDEEQTGIDFDFDDATPAPTEPPKPVEVAPQPTPAPTPKPKVSILEDPESSLRETLIDRQKEEEGKELKKRFPQELTAKKDLTPFKDKFKEKEEPNWVKDYTGESPVKTTKENVAQTKRVAGEAITQSAEFAPQLTTGKAAYDLLVKAPVDVLDSVLPNAAGEKSIPKKLVDKFYESTGLDRADKESAGIRKELKDFGVPQAKTKGESLAGAGVSLVAGGLGPVASVKALGLAEDIARSERTAQFLKDESGMLRLPGQKPEPIDEKTTLDEFKTSSLARSISSPDDASSISSKAETLDQKIKENSATPADFSAVAQPNLTTEDIVHGYHLFESDPVMMAYYAKDTTTRVGDNTIDTYIREVKPKDQTFKEKVGTFLGDAKSGVSKRNFKRQQTTTAMTLNKFALQRDLQRNMLWKDKDIYGPDYHVGRKDLLDQSPHARIEVFNDTGSNARRSLVSGKEDFVLVPTRTEDGGVLNTLDTSKKSLYKSLDDAGMQEGTQEFSDLMQYVTALDNLDQYNLNNKRIVDLSIKSAKDPSDLGLKREIKELQEYNYDMPVKDIFRIVEEGNKNKVYTQYASENRDRNFLTLDLMEREGILTSESVKNIKNARPNYIHNIREWKPEDPTLPEESFDLLFNIKRTNPKDVVVAREGKNYGERVNPFIAQEEYLNKAMNTIMKNMLNRASLNFYLQLPDDQWAVFFREPKANVLNALNSLGRLSPEAASIFRNKILSITDMDNFPTDRDAMLARVKDFGLSQRDQLIIENRIPELEELITNLRDKVYSNRSPKTSEQGKAELSAELDKFIQKLGSTAPRSISRTDILPSKPGEELPTTMITYNVGGNKIQLTLRDPELFRYFQSNTGTRGKTGALTAAARAVAMGSRNMVILNPEFSVMVHARETQDTLAFRDAASKLTDKLLRTASYVPSIANRFTYLAPELRATHLRLIDNLFGGNRYREYNKRIHDFKANYGGHLAYEGYIPERNLSLEERTKRLEEGTYLAPDRGTVSTAYHVTYDGLNNIASRFDMAPRMWLYDNLVKRGMSKVEAQHLANNMGVNFMQEGIPMTSSPTLVPFWKSAEGHTLREYTSNIAFLTAGLNGLYRAVGLFRYEPKIAAASIFTVAAYYGAIETSNQSAINPKTGKPFIDELPDYIKANKLIWYPPNAKSKEDYYQFPLGFITGPAAKNSIEAVKDIHSAVTLSLSNDIKEFINGGLPEVWELEEFNTPEKREEFRRDLLALGKTPEDIARLAVNTLSQTFSIPLTFGQYQPILDLAAGEQARTGLSLEGEKGRYDYGTGTSLSIKKGVDAFNDAFHTDKSPKNVDIFIKSLTGLVGQTAFKEADNIFTSFLVGQELPAQTTRDIPFVRGFRGNVGGRVGTQYSQVYRNMSESLFDPLKRDLTNATNDKDFARVDAINKQYARELDLLKIKDSFDKSLAGLYQQRKDLMFPKSGWEQGEFGRTPEREVLGDPNLRARLNAIDDEIAFIHKEFISNVLTSGSKYDIMKYGQHYNRPFSIFNIEPGYEPPSADSSDGSTPTSPNPDSEIPQSTINFDFR